MVGYLEKTYRVKYDAVHDKSIAGMYVNNHHNASLAHDFSPLGLLVGNGYDTRAFVAELIPVIIFETLIRCYWFYKQKFYYGKSFKESLPIANSRELSRLLLVGNATFTSIDTTHATIKGVIKLVGMALILERL